MSVYKRKDTGRFKYDFQIGGRRFSGPLAAKTQKAAEVEALKKRLKIEEQIAEQKRTGKATLTLDMAACRFWDEVGKFHKDAQKTFVDLRRVVEHLGPNKVLDEITDADVIAMVAWRRAQTPKGKSKGTLVAPATVNRSTTEVLKKLFTRARVAWRYVFPNEPHWRAHMLKEPQARVRELKGDEEKALDAVMRSDYAPWVQFTLLTGLRRAETELKWSNVDWDAKLITTVGKGDRIVTTPITPAVAEVLQSVKGQHDEYVFTYKAMRGNPKRKTVRGQRYPITYEGGKTEWQRLVKRAGVKDFRFHDLRHTTATRLLRETGNLVLVQQALNHRDITTTARYAHVNKTEVANALQRVAEANKKSADTPEVAQPIDLPTAPAVSKTGP